MQTCIATRFISAREKGRKDRYVGLSKLIAQKMPLYLQEVQPKVYLFEGLTPGEPMGERSIQYIITEALQKTSIKKQVSMHTLRHSYATHLAGRWHRHPYHSAFIGTCDLTNHADISSCGAGKNKTGAQPAGQLV
jgi:site-specific recombinase XerC